MPTALVTELFAATDWSLAEVIADGRAARADAVPGLMTVLLDGIALPRTRRRGRDTS